MNLAVPVALASVLFANLSWTRQAPAAEPVRLVLPRNIDTERCNVQYFLTGPFGGYRDGGRARPGVPEYEIETVHDGAAVESLKAFVACSGYQVQAIVMASLPRPDARRVVMAPRPLSTVVFAAVIRGWAAQEALRSVDVYYLPLWTCAFFKIPDCGLHHSIIATVPIKSDGTFSVPLPDLAHDPVIGSFTKSGSQGELSFQIRDHTTGNPIFTLKPTGGTSPFGGLTVRASYPNEQMFDLDPWG